MKVAISGKGGVGKTTLASLLAYLAARDGKQVVAVDADPDANLGSALGFSQEDLARVKPIAEMKDLITERTGAEPGSIGQWFALNPRVSDIPERFWLERDGIRLLVMGGIRGGGTGCACPENALLKHLLRHLVLERDETVIVDMEAGLEHLGRGTARGVDAFLVVVEPGRRSFQTAAMVAQMAGDIGVRAVYVVGNKVHPGEEAAVEAGVSGLPVLGHLPFDRAAVDADLTGEPVYRACPSLVEAAERIRRRLVEGQGQWQKR